MTEAATARFVEANQRLVVMMARRFLNRGLPLLDLVQEVTQPSYGRSVRVSVEELFTANGRHLNHTDGVFVVQRQVLGKVVCMVVEAVQDFREFLFTFCALFGAAGRPAGPGFRSNSPRFSLLGLRSPDIS